MKIKTADLIGPALTWAVATIEGYGGLRRNPHAFDQALIMNRADGQCVLFSTLNYPADWSQGGPIIERKCIGIERHRLDGPREWAACDWHSVVVQGHTCLERSEYSYGPTPLIAAMRCHVTSELGDEVEIPDELMKQP